jgi:hypothetical protein
MLPTGVKIVKNFFYILRKKRIKKKEEIINDLA